MSKTIAIIDYGSGNLFSAAKAFEHVIEEENLPYQVKIENTAEGLNQADRIVLPGQGAFADCMGNLRQVPGMISALEKRVLQDRIPFFGICVGMQLLAEKGWEHGEHEGLGWIAGDVVPLEKTSSDLKIPQMGWNELILDQEEHFLLRSIKSADFLHKHFYFVHSFMFECKDNESLLAHTQYGQKVAAIIAKDNIFGTQFHPEKSQNAGLSLIKDFINWDPDKHQIK